MLRKVMDFINLNKMIEKGDRIVVGVSGGADSVCLLYILRKLFNNGEATLLAVHVNHGLRGKEADHDEQFVEDLCGKWGIEFFRFLRDVRKVAAEEGLSEEEAGRKVRYQAFTEVCQLKNCNKIAVAHNKNDNAETFLFNLFRGAGIKGLSGIEPVHEIVSEDREITVIRPLLCIERKEIEEYLNREGISFQTDSTNLAEDYSRNKIRNKILTYAAAEINSQAIGNINETASKLREAFDYIDNNVTLKAQALVKKEEDGYLLGVGDLLKEQPVIQKGIIRKILENLSGSLKDLEAKHVEAVLSLCGKQVGKQVNLPYGMLAERRYSDIYFKTEALGESLKVETMEPLRPEIPGRLTIPQIGKVLETELIPYKKSEQVPKSSCVKWFDYDKIENAVEVRNRKEGDYIQITAFGGNKKLKDYFIDHKIPQKQRNSQILITDGSHVMWIPGEGERMSEKYKVDETTTKVLLMKLINLEVNSNVR